MSFVRWLHKGWKYFWYTFGIFILLVLVMLAVGFGILQTKTAKTYIATEIEDNFNTRFNGMLTIGGLSGIIPFNFQFGSVALYPDSASTETVFKAAQINAHLDILSLLRGEFIVTGLALDAPVIIINENKRDAFFAAIEKKEAAPALSLQETAGEDSFIEVLAPNVSIKSGRIILRELFRQPVPFTASDSLTIDDINLAMYFEYKSRERFIDIDHLSMNIPELDIPNAEIFGQVYNDSRYLEFNGFNFRAGDSYLKISGRADGVDLLKEGVGSQFEKAGLNLDIEEFVVSPKRLAQFVPELSMLEKPILTALDFEGNFESLRLNRLILQYGNSGFEASGELRNILDQNLLEYSIALKETTLDLDDIEPFLDEDNKLRKSTLSSLIVDANIEGNLRKISGELKGFSDRGSLGLSGLAEFNNSRRLNINFTTDSLDLGGIITDKLKSTRLTASGILKIGDYKNLKSVDELKVTARNSDVNGFNVELFNLNVSSRDKILYPIFTLLNRDGTLSGNGVLDLSGDFQKLMLSGSGNNIHLKKILNSKEMADAVVDVHYDVDVSGSDIDDIMGKVSLEIPRVFVGSDSLPPALFYADLVGKEDGGKIFRLTSSAFDLTIDGQYTLSQLPDIARYWNAYFTEKIEDEVLFRTDSLSGDGAKVFDEHDFSVTAMIKDITPLSKVIPALPEISTSSRLNSNISVNGNRLLFNADWYDNHVKYSQLEADSIRTQITGSFRHDERIKDFSVLELRAEAKKFNTGVVEGAGLNLVASLNRDSVQFVQSIERLGKDVKYRMNGNMLLHNNTITAQIDTFRVGSSVYNWVNRGTPEIIYSRNGRLSVNDFAFENKDQFFAINGVYSEDLTDSLIFDIQGIELDKISDLINGDVEFSGIMNGTFTTRTLLSLPSIEGKLNLDRFALGNTAVGNLQLSSNFNQVLNRFDTNITLLTDSLLFPEYFKVPGREGQDLLITGYIAAPDEGGFTPSDTLYSFDVDVNSVDVWFVSYLAPSVFNKMEGQVTGKGKLWGTMETYDFNLDYDIGKGGRVTLNPVFLETDYFVKGPASFSRKDGLVFSNVDVTDSVGGTGTVNGFYNFNDFSGIDSMDLRLKTDKLQLLDSNFDVDSPIFGKAYGTGEVRMYGSSLKGFIETTTPIMLTADTDVQLPLLEETQFDADNKFIRFVSSFDEPGQTAASGGNSVQSTETDVHDLNFDEKFTLDLQFIADNAITVRLIFDPVTGEVIRSNGTGRIRINLADQDLSIFGRYDITGGYYQFVSGDIFTRRFNLESGGSIAWEGAPDDARININAVFSARPDIQTLTTTRSNIEPNTAQRVPVDLVLNVGGSLSSIQNDFYFRLPNTFESLQNATLNTQINALNQNEEEKLLQATSFLLLESFIPSKASLGGTETLTDNLSTSAGAAVLNPLLSSQVISPLLSNQINSLLRSDISSLDVDFSLNAYNQIDLGVALRLYNDRLILSREGQISGAHSTIGDIGATYRINKVFSVSAFHRQDPTFSSIENGQQTQQAQDINGVGIEAVYSFDTWKAFWQKIINPFRKLFGIKGNTGTERLITEELTGQTKQLNE